MWVEKFSSANTSGLLQKKKLENLLTVNMRKTKESESSCARHTSTNHYETNKPQTTVFRCL